MIGFFGFFFPSHIYIYIYIWTPEPGKRVKAGKGEFPSCCFRSQMAQPEHEPGVKNYFPETLKKVTGKRLDVVISGE